MREIDQVNPQPQTEIEILRHGIRELAQMAPGVHQDSQIQSDPACVDEKRRIKEYALRIEAAARSVRQ